MLHVGLPLNMSVEAINTIVYFTNKGPSTPLGCGIPYEVGNGKKVSYYLLKTFSCEAFLHIVFQNRTTLEAKKRMCICWI